MARPNLIRYMIEESLGYCCEQFFFKHYTDTDLIAARLGVTPRAVRYHKAAARCSSCPKNPGCLKGRFTFQAVTDFPPALVSGNTPSKQDP